MTAPTASTAVRVQLSDGFDLPLDRASAFPLFTARGETRWVDGWAPEFFVEVDDDTAVGTVFRTGTAPERTTWVVVDSAPGERLRYARVEAHGSAGTVTVTLADAAGGCRVDVAYDLTSTEQRSAAHLRRLEAEYATYIASWRTAIVDRVVAG